MHRTCKLLTVENIFIFIQCNSENCLHAYIMIDCKRQCANFFLNYNVVVTHVHCRASGKFSAGLAVLGLS